MHKIRTYESCLHPFRQWHDICSNSCLVKQDIIQIKKLEKQANRSGVEHDNGSSSAIFTT